MANATKSQLGHTDTRFGLTPFDQLSVPIQELWMRKSIDHVSRSAISFIEDNREVVYYLTAVYLYQLSDHTINRMTYPCYAVHCVEEDWRFVTDSARVAFARFKAAAHRNAKYGTNRVAMFHWKAPSDCVRMYATEGYPLDKDYVL